MGTSGLARWAGRTALVTGASSGIGRACAERLARAGLRTVVAARREERLVELAKELAPAEVLPLATDLRDPSSIARLFEATREAFGGVDVLVNNAGLGHAAPLVSGETDAWREMLEVNVLALCICTREAIEDMRTRGDDGHVVHVSSMAGHRVPPGSGVYAATKHAVRALTEGLRRELRELGSEIRVTALSPGFVETEFAANYHGRPDAAKEAYGRYPVLRPEDVADSLVHALAAPSHVQVHDILIRPTRQEL